jgi:radical SAM protein with 4Fe4S-binding SPASM domain
MKQKRIRIMTETYEIRMPYLLTGPASGLLTFFDRRLHGSDDHFIRLDLYPLIAPSHMRRHYGYWDIPLKHIQQMQTRFIFDPAGCISLPNNGGGPLELLQGWRGSIEEDGYCTLHVSLWDKSKDPPHMIEVKSQPLVIAKRGMDLPLKQINIPVTDRCNLKCTMCPRQNTEELIEVDISDNVLQSLLKTASKLSGILLQGLGEPLLYKNIFNLIKQLKREMSADSEVGLTTNATMLNQDTGIRLFDSGVNFLYFSVDAATKKTYEAIRLGADFDSVIKNISQLSQSRSIRGMGIPRFMMNFVITQQNICEIRDFAALAKEVGVENVTYSHCLGVDSGEMELAEKKILKEQFEAAKEVAAGTGLNIYFPPLEKVKEEKCFFMDRAVVLAQGDVIPCHAMAPGYSTATRKKIFGNVKQKSLDEIWDKADFKEFRRRVLTGDFPHECSECECKAYLVP